MATEEMTVMETDRLLLRPWRDGVELQRLLSAPAVRGGRRLPPARIAGMAEGSLRQWRVNGFGRWAATDKTTGCWIGKVGLDELDEWPDIDRIEVGCELHKAWWGLREAARGQDEAFDRDFADAVIEADPTKFRLVPPSQYRTSH